MTDETSKPARLMSLDALRGFDMWFITGGAALIIALCKAFGCGDGWIARQMEHVPWAGLAHHDTIFPLFLFLAGVSWPFSLASQLAKGRTSWQIHRKVLIRSAILYFLGICGGVLAFDPNFRATGVLSFIGVSWGIAALLFLHIRRPLHRGFVIAALLVGYWAVLRFCLAPGAPAGADSYCKEWNVISWLDRTLMPNHIYVRGVYDPESLFSIAGGIAMALLGMSAGSLLKCDALAPAKKALTLAFAACGLAAVDAAFIWGMGDQIVKALWTPSFVLSAAVYSMLMLALFYWVIDVKGWRRWTFYFRVIGMNSITVYMAQIIIGFQRTRNFVFGGLAGCVPADWKDVVLCAGYLAVVWVFLYFLYRKNVFLKV